MIGNAIISVRRAVVGFGIPLIIAAVTSVLVIAALGITASTVHPAALIAVPLPRSPRAVQVTAGAQAIAVIIAPSLVSSVTLRSLAVTAVRAIVEAPAAIIALAPAISLVEALASLVSPSTSGTHAVAIHGSILAPGTTAFFLASHRTLMFIEMALHDISLLIYSRTFYERADVRLHYTSGATRNIP